MLNKNTSQTKLLNKDVKIFYDEQWNFLESFSSINLNEREKWLLSLCFVNREYFKGKRVLVAGSGYGWEVMFFNKWDAEVTGVDLSIEKSLELLEYFNIDTRTTNIKILKRDIESLDLPDSNFDYVYANGILSHTDYPGKALNKLVNVLKPGGIIILGFDGSGGYLWNIVKIFRIIAKITAKLGIKHSVIGKILKSLPFFKENLSNRFYSETTERVIWPLEKVFVPILKNFSHPDAVNIINSSGLDNIYRFDLNQNHYVNLEQINNDIKFSERMKKGSGYLLYKAEKKIQPA